jgi:hypothetical protein
MRPLVRPGRPIEGPQDVAANIVAGVVARRFAAVLLGLLRITLVEPGRQVLRFEFADQQGRGQAAGEAQDRGPHPLVGALGVVGLAPIQVLVQDLLHQQVVSLDHLLADQCRPQLFGLLAVRVKAMFLAAVPGVVALAFFVPPDTALPRHVRDLLELKFTFNPQLDQQTNQAVE